MWLEPVGAPTPEGSTQSGADASACVLTIADQTLKIKQFINSPLKSIASILGWLMLIKEVTMRLTRDTQEGDYEVRAYEPGKIKINDTFYSHSLLLGAHLLTAWPPQTVQQLSANHLALMLKFKPEVILLGTGEHLVFPERALLKTFYDNKIGIEVMSSLSACHTFNVLMSERRNAIAAILIC